MYFFIPLSCFPFCQYKPSQQTEVIRHKINSELTNNFQPNLQVAMSRGPIKAKGLLLSCIRDDNPCIFLEPKVLYRSAVEMVPTQDYTLPLSSADILVEGEVIGLLFFRIFYMFTELIHLFLHISTFCPHSSQ